MRERISHDRLGVFDGLRGLAILLVVWYHLRLVSNYVPPLLAPFDLFARGGFLGVDLFFFVSGFCIAYPYVRAAALGRPMPRVGEFVRRRALKIVPSYLLALVVFALVYRARFTSPADEVTSFLAHVTFVHVWFPDSFGSFSGPLWTLGVEVQFYALFALIAPLAARRPLIVYAAFVAVATAYRIVLAVTGLDTQFVWLNQLPAVLDVFGAGMLAALCLVALGVHHDERARFAGRRATVIALGASALVVAGFVAVDAAARAGGDDQVHRWLNGWRVLFGPVLCAATLGVALGSARLRALVEWRTLAHVSGISYNAYLWNLELAVGLQALGLPDWATFWYGAIATATVAALITYAYERPLMRARATKLRARVPAVFAFARGATS